MSSTPGSALLSSVFINYIFRFLWSSFFLPFDWLAGWQAVCISFLFSSISLLWLSYRQKVTGNRLKKKKWLGIYSIFCWGVSKAAAAEREEGVEREGKMDQHWNIMVFCLCC